jgi:hypothetical protein
MGVELIHDLCRSLGASGAPFLSLFKNRQAVATAQDALLNQSVEEGERDRSSGKRHIALGQVFHGFILRGSNPRGWAAYAKCTISIKLAIIC